MADTLFGGAALAGSFDDDGEQRRRGHDATPNTDGTLTALYYCVPTTGVPEGVGSVAMMYVINDADEFQCEVDLQAVIPGASPGWTRIDASDFTPAGPVDWPNGTRLRGWVATVGDGSPLGKVLFTEPGSFPKVSTPDGHLTAASGLYGGSAVPPDTIPGSYNAHWDMDFEFTAAATTVDGTFQATTAAAPLAGAGHLVDVGALAMGVSGFNLDCSGRSVNGGTAVWSVPPAIFSASESAVIKPGLGTPGGAVVVPAPAGGVLAPAAGGTVQVPAPSGRP